jgi:PAS domain S-box-containing protein
MPEPTTGMPPRQPPSKPGNNVVHLGPDPAHRDATLCHAILESASDYAIITTDLNGRITSWNAGARNLLGWEEAEALGMYGRLLFTPEDREHGAPEAEMAQAQAAGRAEDERWHLRRDGSRFWGSGLMTPLRHSTIPGFLKIMRDRTDRQQAQAALAAAHHRTSEILESITDAFYAVDRDWRLTYVNCCTEQLWGRPREQLLGRRLWEVFPDVAGLQATEDYQLHVQAARDRTPVQAEFRSAVLQSWVSISLYPQADGGLSVYFRDVSVRKEAEERQALLLQELAHRVKNTLALVLALARQTGARATAVAGFLDLFEGRLRALAVVHELLTESGWRSASLVELAQMVLAAHGGPGEADGAERITIALADDVALRPATVQDLVLILHELATNAAKHGALAMPGGVVTLEGRIEDDALVLVWREDGGPPAAAPLKRGFGTTLLEQVVKHQQGGRVEFDWQRPGGLACTLYLPLAAVADGAGERN